MNKKSKNLTDKLWDIFSSMKTGLILLGLTALVLALGTIFPQNDSDTVGFWNFIGLNHVYSSVWFRLLMGLLCVNLLVCSIQRFHGTCERTFRPQFPSNVDAVPQKLRYFMNGESTELRKQAQEKLHGSGYRVRFRETASGWSFTAQKKRWGNWGAYVVHVGFVILILGALGGSLFGFAGSLMALNGDTVDFQDIKLSQGHTDRNYSVKINAVEDRFLANGERDNWYSDISIVQGDQELARGMLSVNHPFTYDGVTYYQEHYQDVANLSLEVDGKKYNDMIPLGLTQNEGTVQSDFYYQRLSRIQDSKLFFKGLKVKNQPVVYLQVYSMDGKVSNPLKLSLDQKDAVFGQSKITLSSLTNATGLHVKCDPAVPFVWFGCALIMLGLMLSFFWQPLLVTGYFNPSLQNGTLTLGMLTGRIAGKNDAYFGKIIDKLKN